MKKILSLILCFIVFAAGVLSVPCVNAQEQISFEQTNETENNAEMSSSFIKIDENENFSLFYSEYTGEVAVKNNKTNYIWYSNPQSDSENSEENISESLKSQLIFSYYNGSSSEVMDSYTNGILNENIPEFDIEDNILKVKYLIGNTAFTTDMLPPVMTKESLEKDILSKLNEEERDKVTSRYTFYERDSLDKDTYKKVELSFPSIKDYDLYVLGSGIPSYIAKGIYELFLKAGYTIGDLQKYCDENGVKNRYEEKPFFKAELQFSLTDSGLNVKLNPKSIEYAEAYQPTRVDILPYFGSADSKTNGYLLVPDGSGAVINFNNGKTSNGAYEKLIYTTDNAITKTSQYYGVKETSLPFFGLASSKGSFLATIDSGYEVAGVFADISGRNSSYNNIYSYFTIFSSDVVSVSGHQLDNFVKFAEDIFSDTYSITYNFTDGYSTYSELALIYRDYLKNNGILKEKATDKSSINLSFIGATEVTKSFLGIPYKTMAAYTTLDDVKTILSELKINDADIRLTDFTSGGSNPKNTASLKLQGSVGKINKVNKLYNLTDTSYLSVYSQYQSKASGSKRAVSISQDDAYMLNYNFVNGFKENSNYLLLLSSKILSKNSDKLIGQINKNKLEAINLRDIGYELNSDFDDGAEIDRHKARINAQEYMKKISDKAELSVDKGSIYALPFVNKIWDIPMCGSNYHIEDYSVPFYQMAISGYVNYVAAPFNDNSDIKTQFLKAVEYGAQPQFALTYKMPKGINYYQEKYYGYLYENHIDSIKELSDKYSKISDAINGSSIVNHEGSENCAVTEYENGVKLYINYSNSDLFIKGKTVSPQDILIEK